MRDFARKHWETGYGICCSGAPGATKPPRRSCLPCLRLWKGLSWVQKFLCRDLIGRVLTNHEAASGLAFVCDRFWRAADSTEPTKMQFACCQVSGFQDLFGFGRHCCDLPLEENWALSSQRSFWRAEWKVERVGHLQERTSWQWCWYVLMNMGGCQINPGHAVFSSTCSTLVMVWSVARQGRLNLSRATACKAQIDKISQRLLQTWDFDSHTASNQVLNNFPQQLRNF